MPFTEEDLIENPDALSGTLVKRFTVKVDSSKCTSCRDKRMMHLARSVDCDDGTSH